MNKRKKEVEELIKFCTMDNRVCPVPKRWAHVMKILKFKEQDKDVQGTIRSLILSGWSFFSNDSKKKRLHHQIRFAGLWSNNDKMFNELKKYLLSIEKECWHYTKRPYGLGRCKSKI